MLAFKNHQVIDQIALMDRAVQYGDGGFTTANVIAGKIQLRQRHQNRLSDLCQRLCLHCDDTRIEAALDFMEQQLAANADHGTLKVMISRGVGARGYSLPMHDADIYCMFYPSAAPKISQIQTIDACQLTRPLACLPAHLAGLKTLNRLEQVFLKQELDQTTCQEGFCFDLQENLVEGVMSNCFVYLDGQWHTPDLASNGIVGVMRAEILQRFEHYGVLVKIAAMHKETFQGIESAFFCNALNTMQAVRMLNSRPLSLEPCIQLFKQLQLDQIV